MLISRIKIPGERHKKKVIDPEQAPSYGSSPLMGWPLFTQLPAREPFAWHRKRLGLVTLVLIT